MADIYSFENNNWSCTEHMELVKDHLGISCPSLTQSLKQSNVTAAIQCSLQVSLKVQVSVKVRLQGHMIKPSPTDKHKPKHSQPRHNNVFGIFYYTC